MFRILFLLIVLLTSVAFAQTEEASGTRKFDEFGPANDEDIHARIDGLFLIGLKSEPNSVGYIINYGTGREIAKREAQIKIAIALHRLDIQKVKFINAGYSKNIMTQFWIVPPGGEEPKLIPSARILEEFGRLSGAQWKKRMDAVRAKLVASKYENAQFLIVNYGTDKEIAAAETLIKKHLFENCYDCFGEARVTFMRGGLEKKPRRVFWVVPAGAEMPTP